MKIRIFSLFSVLALGACAYATGGNNQDVMFIAQDVENAKCDIWVDELRYQVYPPQTVNIKKSPKDMIMKCHAAGNRVVETEVPAEFSSRSLWGSPAGVAWDYASESLFRYPSVIAVDFSQEVVTPNDFPAHYDEAMPDPESYDLEDVGATVPRLNSDKSRVDMPLVRRDIEPQAGGSTVEELVNAPPRDMKVLTDVSEGGDNMPVSSDDPVSLFPGK